MQGVPLPLDRHAPRERRGPTAGKFPPRGGSGPHYGAQPRMTLLLLVLGGFAAWALSTVAAGGGAIVATSSVAGVVGFPGLGPYVASKHAVAGLVQTAALELAPANIRVNAVAPGLFLTGRLQAMYDEMPEAERREVLDAIPLDRFPELREIVDPVLFLASEEASYITGVVLDVNGGRFMPL